MENISDKDLDIMLNQMTSQEIEQYIEEYNADIYNSSMEASEAQYL